VNGDQVQQCLDSGATQSLVQNQQLTGTAAGITGTPGTILVKKDGSTQLISGAIAYVQLQQIIDQALKQ